MPSFWENLRFPGEREFDHLEGMQGQDMATYVSHPAPSANATFPAVIVVMEAFGVVRHIEKVCDRFAQEGIRSRSASPLPQGPSQPQAGL